jgi:hypothetical protein
MSFLPKTSKISVPFLVLLAFIPLFSTQSQNLFEKKYGTIVDDRATGIIKLADGGFIVAGHLDTGSNLFDLCAFRLNYSGDVVWAKRYGGAGDDGCRGIVQTTDGNFVLMGYNGSNGFGGYDVLAIKIDPNGNQLWSAIVGDTYLQEGFAISATNDGGVVITGYTKTFDISDVYTIKLDQYGSLIWTSIIGYTFKQWGASIIQTKDGGYLITGITDVGSDWDPDFNTLILKLNSVGNLVWIKHFGGVYTEEGRGITEIEDSSFVIVGKTNSFGGEYESLIGRFSKDGNLLWMKIIGSPNDDIANSVDNSVDGTLIVGGQTNTNQFGSQSFLMKLDYSGNLIWQKNYGQAGQEIGSKVICISNSAYALVGTSSSQPVYFDNNFYVVVTDTSGSSQCPSQTIYPNIRTATLTIYPHQFISGSGGSIINTSQPVSNLTLDVLDFCDFLPVELESFNHSFEGNKTIINWSTATEINNRGFEIYRDDEAIKFIEGQGTTTEKHNYSFMDIVSTPGTYLYRLIQVDFDGTQEELGSFEAIITSPKEFILNQNYPNPFNPLTTITFNIPFDINIKLKLYDSIGNEIKTLIDGYIAAGYHSYDLIATGLSSGVYFYNLQAGDFQDTKKLLLLK